MGTEAGDVNALIASALGGFAIVLLTLDWLVTRRFFGPVFDKWWPALALVSVLAARSFRLFSLPDSPVQVSWSAPAAVFFYGLTGVIVFAGVVKSRQTKRQ
jgi:hypothetical protein